MTWKINFLLDRATWKMAHLLYACLLGVLLLANGCSSKVELDTSLATDEPCAVPCWHNIIPGVSTENDVRTRLENSSFVKAGTVNYNLTEQYGTQLGMFTWKARGKLFNRAYLRDGQVLRIEIELDYDLTLGEIVDKYGSPETFYVVRNTPDISWYWITCDYSSIGLIVEGYVKIKPEDVNNGTVLLSEDTKITRAIYYPPMSIQDVLSKVFLLPSDQLDYFMTIRQKWQGFGYIKFVK